MRLDDDMRRVVREQSLGFAATVCPDGTPNVSPKGTTIVWGEAQLAFLDLHSPGTVANLGLNRAIEVNVVDPIVRKGYRFKGRADVLTSGPVHDEILASFRRERGTDTSRVHHVVLIDVETAAPLVSPAYDDGRSEVDVITTWRERFAAHTAARLHAAGVEGTAEARLVRRFYDEAWNRWDDDVVEELLAAGFHFRGSLGDETQGRDAWRVYRDRVRLAVPDFHNEIVDLVTEPGRAAARLRYTGHHRGTLLGVQGRGQPIEYRGSAFFSSGGGQLQEAWVLGDVDALRHQLEQ